MKELIYRVHDLKQKNFPLGPAVNATQNCHSSFHVRTCFRKGNKECHYRFPQHPNAKRTRIEVPEEPEDWYDDTGRPYKKRIIEVVPKRSEFDIMMNTYSPVISDSYIACNTNVKFISNGVQAFYITKYSSKNTQKDDASEYEPIIKYVEGRLISLKFDTDRSEALSRIIGASLAHNRRCVCWVLSALHKSTR